MRLTYLVKGLTATVLLLVDGGMTAGRPISVSVNERAQLAQAFTALREAS